MRETGLRCFGFNWLTITQEKKKEIFLSLRMPVDPTVTCKNQEHFNSHTYIDTYI